MFVKNIIEEDFCNYSKPSMFIIFPSCSFKCDKEAGCTICQNSALAEEPNIEIPVHKIIHRYENNNISKAIVCGGLEPFDSWEDLRQLIVELRMITNDDIVIYTGYNKEEILEQLIFLNQFANIIVKFGRYVPNGKSRFDEILGVELASDNQYAERIS